MAVIEVQPPGLRLKLVDELAARFHDLEHAIHVGRVDPVEVDGVWVGAPVKEPHAQHIAGGHPQRRSRNLPVIGPGREEHARRDLDFLVHGNDVELAQRAAIRQRRNAAVVKGLKEDHRVELGGVHRADGARVVVRVIKVVDIREARTAEVEAARGGLGAAIAGASCDGDRRGCGGQACGAGGRAAQQTASCQAGHAARIGNVPSNAAQQRPNE